MEVIMKNKQFIEDAKSAWAEVFPNSRCYANGISNSVCFAGYLSKDASECANKIINNDPLSYKGWYNLDKPDVYKESNASVFIKPEAGSYNVYGRAKLRHKSINNPDRAKLLKRFLELRDFLRGEAGNMINLHFNINEKLGV
jgi:hypothetical protein